MKIDEKLELLLLRELTGSDDVDFAGYGPGEKNLGRVWLEQKKSIKKKRTAELRGDDRVQVSVTDWEITLLGWNRLQVLERRG